jgi:putative transposase
MSQSLANIVVHLVFSTKGRRQLLRAEERGELHAYITGILKNLQSPLIEINSVRDHIHILFVQSKNHAPAKIVEEVKTSSSRWLRERYASYAGFAWQAGYGEFSVSPIHVESVREYIRQQPEHHRQEDFQTEYRRFARRMVDRWMNDMRGIEITRMQSIRTIRYGPTGLINFWALVPGPLARAVTSWAFSPRQVQTCRPPTHLSLTG